MICKCFLPFHWLPCQYIDGVFQWTKVFKFCVVPFMIFTFAVFASGITLCVWYVILLKCSHVINSQFIQFSVVFSISTRLCSHPHCLVFFITLDGSPGPFKQSLPISPLPQPLQTTNLLSIPLNLLTLDTSCKWDHTVCGLLPGFSHWA